MQPGALAASIRKVSILCSARRRCACHSPRVTSAAELRKMVVGSRARGAGEGLTPIDPAPTRMLHSSATGRNAVDLQQAVRDAADTSAITQLILRNAKAAISAAGGACDVLTRCDAHQPVSRQRRQRLRQGIDRHGDRIFQLRPRSIRATDSRPPFRPFDRHRSDELRPFRPTYRLPLLMS